MAGNIFLRDAAEEDAVFLFDLVNDSECRNNSFHTGKVIFEEHLKWLEMVLASQKQKQYILVEGEKPIGQGRLELMGDACRISYSIIPERRGCGYGKVLVQLLNNAIIREFPECQHSYGEVLKKNVSSQRIFEELEYDMEEQEDCFYYRKQAVYYAEHQIYLKNSGGGGILLLSNNRNSYCLYQWMIKCNEQVYYYSGKLTAGQIQFLSPQLIVSYNYGMIVPETIVRMADCRIINLHISYLPWNRGSDPNFWSFFENTPKGVTIHQIDAGLDTGKVVFQKECYFEPEKETFISTYDKLNKEIVELFKENWEVIREGKYTLHKQQGEGSYHTTKDLEELKEKIDIDWSDNIAEFLRKYKAFGSMK